MATFGDITSAPLLFFILRGYVYYTQKVLVYTSCNMDPSLYPLDVQQCHIDFASPGFPINKRQGKDSQIENKHLIFLIQIDENRRVEEEEQHHQHP